MTDGYNRLHRHVETVRNYLGACIRELMNRQEQHDQSKFEEPELSAYLSMGHVRNMDYGSDEYWAELKKFDVAVRHHHAHSRDHFESYQRGHHDMTLVDLLAVICDWKAATLRTAKGDLVRSIEVNQAHYGYSDELKEILVNTARWLNDQHVFHKASES